MFSLLSAYARSWIATPEPVSEFELLRARDAAVKVERAIRFEMALFGVPKRMLLFWRRSALWWRSFCSVPRER